MKIREYVIRANRFAKDLGSLDLNYIHFMSGVHSEVGELLSALKRNFAYGKEIDMVNVKEEVGDIIWFSMHSFLMMVGDGEDGLQFPIESTNAYADTLSEVIYQKTDAEEAGLYDDMDFAQFAAFIIELSNDIGLSGNGESVANALISIVVELVRMFKLDVHEVMEMNIAKLTERNKGEGFNNENTINRDIDKEKEILTIYNRKK